MRRITMLVFVLCVLFFSPVSAAQQGGIVRGAVYGKSMARIAATQRSYGSYRSSVDSSLLTGWKYQVLYSFKGLDGNSPAAALASDRWGNLYGTTTWGGSYSSTPPCAVPASLLPGCGVVFKLDTEGKETVLHSFTGGADGGFPQYATMLLDPWKNIYGTVTNGGLTSCGISIGCGVVFKLTPGGKETVLHSFSGPDGAEPFAGLVSDHIGIFYGVAGGGPGLANGVLYEIKPHEHFSLLHIFSGGEDGGCPFGNLILDGIGNLYGAGECGGLTYGGPGVIFRFSPTGNETILHNFTGYDEGYGPGMPLLRDFLGNIYGAAGGGHFNLGIVYKFDQSGKETVLHTFTGGTDGSYPNGGLVGDFWGNLYGTTFLGGAFGGGVVYKIDRWGKETVLYAFKGLADGANPLGGGLLRDSWGNLYGTTNSGGILTGNACAPIGCGVVFKLSPY